MKIHANRRRRRLRWKDRVSLILIAFVLFGTVAAAVGQREASAAREPLELVVEAGFDGKVKEGRWYPVKMTITNPGEDVSGDLAVQIAGDPGRNKDFVYAKRVDLPRRTTKVVWFTLPGKLLNSGNNQVAFYETSVTGGKTIPFVQGTVAIETKPVPSEALFVGVMARDPDTLNFLSLLNQRGYQIHTARLSAGDFPWEAAMLDGLDVIALNDVPSDVFTPEQVKEIQAWVERGGQLILAGGAGYPKTAAAFESLSPVAYRSTASVMSLAALAEAAGKELALSDPFTVSVATVKAGETLFAEKDVPLVVRRPLGLGAVTYVAYDLALQPVASWSGNPALWERLLSGQLLPNAQGKGGMKPAYPDIYWELNPALDRFPQLVPPAFWALALLLLGYVALVAPVLYFVLKKIDRREWAWFAVPAVAVLSSLLIYGIGASGRGATLSQTLAVNEISESGGGSKTSASSFFVPKGGDYEIEWSGKRNVSPFILFDSGVRLAGAPEMTIRQEPDRTAVRFEDVPYWSVRKVLTAEETVADIGKFAYSMKLDAAGMEGEVVNNTKADLYEAGIVVGQQWVRLGDLKRGEKKRFQVSFGGAPSGNFVFSPGFNLGDSVFPYRGSRDDKVRERALLNAFSQRKWNEHGDQQPSTYLIGFAASRQTLFRIDGSDVPSDQIELFVQQMKLDFVQGDRILIPRGAVQPYVATSSVTHMGPTYGGGIDIGKGELTLEYKLPFRQDWQFTKLTLYPGTASGVNVELWNEKKQAWESLGSETAEYDEARMAELLTGDKKVRLKVTNGQHNDIRFRFPELSVEGTVKR